MTSTQRCGLVELTFRLVFCGSRLAPGGFRLFLVEVISDFDFLPGMVLSH